METIKDYVWFIKESQKFMRGYNPFYVFVKSLVLAIPFCVLMKRERY